MCATPLLILLSSLVPLIDGCAQKSVRHNLSSNGAFVRYREGTDESVWWWTLDDDIIKEMKDAPVGFVPQSLTDGRYKLSQEKEQERAAAAVTPDDDNAGASTEEIPVALGLPAITTVPATASDASADGAVGGGILGLGLPGLSPRRLSADMQEPTGSLPGPEDGNVVDMQRPDMSYAQLAALAVYSSPNHSATVASICHMIITRYFGGANNLRVSLCDHGLWI